MGSQTTEDGHCVFHVSCCLVLDISAVLFARVKLNSRQLLHDVIRSTHAGIDNSQIAVPLDPSSLSSLHWSSDFSEEPVR